MRLWHTYLIDVLPREQLVGQWRECSALCSNLISKGTPSHVLCNFIIDYDYNHFISYAYYIRQEMTRRGYRTMNNVWDKIVSLKPNWELLDKEKIYYEKMNSEYLTICYYNLYEKFLCGGIHQNDWNRIELWRDTYRGHN